MNTKSNINLEQKHEKMKNLAQIYRDNISRTYEKIEMFHHAMRILKDSFLITNPNECSPFDEINEIFKNFSNDLNTILEPIEKIVLQSLKYLNDNINRKVNNSDEILNKIIEKISEVENFIGNKNGIGNNENDTNNFFNYSNLTISEEDEKIFKDAFYENKKQLYNYEIQEMHESINEKYLEYDKLHKELNNIIVNSSEISLVFKMFSDFVKQFCNILTNFSSQLMLKFDNKNIKKDIKNEKKINHIKNNLLNNNTSNNNFIISDKNKQFTENEKKINSIIQEIINSQNKLKLQKINNIINQFDINFFEELFLTKLSDFCLKGILLVKNKDNFDYLASILNAIFFKEISNLNLSKQIIIISKHIKYENKYLYILLQKKNKYLRTKSFWRKIIEHDLINNINEYIDEILCRKQEEKEKEKEKEENKKKEDCNINLIFKNLGIEQNISSNFKKLNNHQIIELYKYTQNKFCSILSKYIPSLYKYSVDDKNIYNIIKYYRDILSLNNDIITYLQNKLRILNYYSKSKYRQQYFTGKDRQTHKISFIISSVLKYLPQEEYNKYLLLSKSNYSEMKKIVFNNIFSKEKLSLEMHLKYLGQYLRIYKNKKGCDYKYFKNLISNSYLESNKDVPKINKIKELIQNDLNRTSFLKQNKKYYEPIKSILNTFCFTCAEIGYIQGLHTLVSLLFQLLNYDEEKTFHYLYCLQFNTDFHLIFENQFAFLNVLFSVFEKILKLFKPEISYILKYIKIDINYFCSSWFLNLFAGYFHIINREEPPLLFIYFIEKFCINGWSAIFNFGLTILEIGYENIIKLEKDELIKYIMQIIHVEKIFDNANYEKCRKVFERNEKYINQYLVDKLIEIVKFEYKNKYLIDSS